MSTTYNVRFLETVVKKRLFLRRRTQLICIHERGSKLYGRGVHCSTKQVFKWVPIKELLRNRK